MRVCFIYMHIVRTSVISGNMLDTKRWPRCKQRIIAIFVRSLQYFTRKPYSRTPSPYTP